MSTEAARVRLTTADTRIHITHRTARWDDRPATLSDALDFWSFAAGAANVVMQLSSPGGRPRGGREQGGLRQANPPPRQSDLKGSL
jgi:hypothetical protein